MDNLNTYMNIAVRVEGAAHTKILPELRHRPCFIHRQRLYTRGRPTYHPTYLACPEKDRHIFFGRATRRPTA